MPNPIYGSFFDDVLVGTDNDDIFYGFAGADQMYGGKGSDTYYVDNVGDKVVEFAGQGTDTVISSITYTLTSNVENLTLDGGNINGYGNALDNTIIGSDGNNILNGGAGADTMNGGKGNDVYIVDNLGDKVVEALSAAQGGGTDTVLTAVNFSLANLANVENLQANSTASMILTGNDLNNTITGGSNYDYIDGGKGADTMIGGAGSDTYYLDDINDKVVEKAGEGSDTIVTSLLLQGPIANVENYFFMTAQDVTFTTGAEDNYLKGGSGNDVLHSGDGENVIEGEGGNDVLIGGTGNDGLDGGAGNDWLDAGGGQFNTLFGQDGNDIMIGGAGQDTFFGGSGTNLMWGGTGDDNYYIESTTDTVLETTAGAAGGNDSVWSQVSIAKLWDNVENAYLYQQGTADLNLTGNAGDNTLMGNEGNNIIDGGVGRDWMSGGKGDDTYIVDSVLDMVVEGPGYGTDTVKSSASAFTLSADVENLILTGVGNIAGTGNMLHNVITGNDGANTLDGGGGDDTLVGGKGNDIYIVDSQGDQIVETLSNAAGGGYDTVYSSVDYSLAGMNNVEQLILTGKGNLHGTGNDGNNWLAGNDGNNVLDGGVGSDAMLGGKGDDTYYIDSTTDSIHENAGEGTDTVISTVALQWNYGDVENYTFNIGTALHFTADGSNNVIHGGSAGDTIDGGGGLNHLFGEGGEDTLKGGSSTDWLDGGANNDTLIGGKGSDTLTGGSGADTFMFDMTGAGDGKDQVTDFLKAGDILDFTVGDANKDGKINLSDLFASVSGVVDHGAGQAVDVNFTNGSSITFNGAGTGQVNSIDDLVSNAATQIHVH